MKENGAFVFIIPIRNPEDDKVKDYNTIEHLLKRTLQSLNSQTYHSVHTVVVGHRVPAWMSEFANATFLDIAKSPVFPPNTNHVRVDKGLKYIIGTLYAVQQLNPELVMLMDADDYVNVHLASQMIHKSAKTLKHYDGFLIHKGAQVNLLIQPDYSVDYQQAYIVRKFDQTCGSCRVFGVDALLKPIKAIAPDLETQFKHWPSKNHSSAIEVPQEPVAWLNEVTKATYLAEESIVNVLGRHIDQETHFTFAKTSLVGAAKGCGHGNHDGPRQGAIHNDKIIKPYHIARFLADFGLAAPEMKVAPQPTNRLCAWFQSLRKRLG